jgi:hypothetical protein
LGAFFELKQAPAYCTGMTGTSEQGVPLYFVQQKAKVYVPFTPSIVIRTIEIERTS